MSECTDLKSLIDVIVNHEEEMRNMKAQFKAELARRTAAIEELEKQTQALSGKISESLVTVGRAEEHAAEVALKLGAVASYLLISTPEMFSTIRKLISQAKKR